MSFLVHKSWNKAQLFKGKFNLRRNVPNVDIPSQVRYEFDPQNLEKITRDIRLAFNFQMRSFWQWLSRGINNPYWECLIVNFFCNPGLKNAIRSEVETTTLGHSSKSGTYNHNPCHSLSNAIALWFISNHFWITIHLMLSPKIINA